MTRLGGSGLVLLLVAGWPALTVGDDDTGPREATREEVAIFLGHLRARFDDIHDVSMRFHAADPSIDGTITLAMIWRDGRLESGEVTGNDTGCEEEGRALLDAVRGWQIAGLVGPARLVVPLRIRLVGRDDPAFPSTGILTGSVRDAGGRPLHRARIRFEPRDPSLARVPDAVTNREGIFVRTLIPPGDWDLVCTADGHREASLTGVRLSAGQHRREDLVLAPSRE